MFAVTAEAKAAGLSLVLVGFGVDQTAVVFGGGVALFLWNAG